jgi:sugar lactone lactonase YvrE
MAIAVLALAGCADDASTSSTTTSTSSAPSTTRAVTTTFGTTTTTIAAPEVQSVVDIGGTQLLGLAVTADAVWPVSYDAGTVSRVDPTTNTVIASYEVPGAASALALGGVVWVASYGGSPSVVALDAQTGAMRTSAQAGEVCCDLTSDDEGDVWAVDPAGRVVEISDGGVSRGLPVDIDARNAHTNVVYAGGSLWVSSDTTPLHRIDPASGATTDIDVGGGVPFLQHDGLVWGASPTDIWAVDPTTGEVAERIELEGSREVLSLNFDAEGDLWVGIRRAERAGRVLQLDRTTGAVKTELRVVDIPARIEFGFGSIWITDSGSSSLYRVAA